MTLQNYLRFSLKPSHKSSITKTARKTMNWLGALVVIVSLATSTPSQETTTTAENGMTPSGLAAGSVTGSYPLSGLENINLYNGNLSFRLPLMMVGGRGNAAAPIGIALNTKSWKVKHYHKVMPDENEIDWFSPTQQNCGGGSTGYNPGFLSGRRTGLLSSYSASCGTRYGWTLSRVTFVLPDGTQIEMRDTNSGGEPKSVAGYACSSGYARGTVFTSADGSAATFISDAPITDNGTTTTLGCEGFSASGYVILRDGTRYRIDNGLVTWIRDRNGNKITYAYDANGRPTTITDQLNRQITFNYDVSAPAPYGLSDQIIFKGSGGAQRIIHISKTALANALRPNSGFSIQTHQQLFPELNHSSTTTTHNPTVVSKVWLPNSDATGQHYQYYQFFYNSYGELSRVELPTGGAVEYDMTPGSGVVNVDDPQIIRRVRERRVYADGSSGSTFESKTTYEVTSDAGLYDPYPWSSTVTTETTSQSGVVFARSRHVFDGSAFRSLFYIGYSQAYSVWNEGREKQTDILDTSGPLASATVLRRTQITMQQRAPVSWWSAWASAHSVNPAMEPPNDPRITQTTTTIEPSGANLVTKQVFGYDDSAVPFNNQNNVKEYAFGTGAPGGLLRETRTTFVTAAGYTGTGVHIRSLPSQISIYDDGGIERSRATVEYDNYSATTNHAVLTDRPNISGFDSSFGTQYTTRGNATASTMYFLSNGAVTGSISTFTQYDIAGNAVKLIDARGFATTSDFSDRFGGPDAEARTNSSSPELSAAGKLSYAYPTLITNPLGHTIHTQFDYYLGKPVDQEDPNGITSTSHYDDLLDRSTQVINVSNQTGAPKSQVSFGYDDLNRIVTTTGDQTTFNDPNPLKSQTVLDQLGRTIEIRQYESASAFITAKTNYDALGRAYRTSNPYRAGENVLWTTSVFDALGRVMSVTTPDSAVVTTSYSGNTMTVSDQDGKSRRRVTDALGRLILIYEDPIGANPLNYLTSYSYDVLNNLTTVSQGSQTRTFVYDSLKRLTSATNPESGTIGYLYDANGNLTQKTDARGVVSTYAYDVLNRNTTVNYSDTAINPDITRIYDTGTNGIGRLRESYSGGNETSGSNVEHAKIQSYDALGRPLDQRQRFKTNSVWSAEYQTQRSYDLAGNVRTQTYPSGHAVTYNYDAAGRLGDKDAQNLAFTGNLGDGLTKTYASEVTYSPFGSMTKEKLGTDTALYNKSFYNSRGQLAEIRVGTYNASDNTWWNRGAIINFYSTCWGMCGGHNSSTPMTDNNGNLKRQEVYIPGNDGITVSTMWTQQYDYDSLNRLQRVHEYNGSDFQQEYVYDRYGNRTLHQTNTWGIGINKKDFTVNPANNRLGIPGGQSGTMTYDAAGNLTVDTYSGSAVSRAYDAENRMTSETQAGSVVAGTYTYNADGQRVRRKINGVETWQIYGLDGELLAEYAASVAPASPQKEYGYRNGQLLITATAGVANSGLVGYWKFDENAGTTAADSSGNGNTGTLVSSATWALGHNGAAVNLNGVSGFVKIKDGKISTATSGTISGWVKINTLANTPKIVGYGGSAGANVQAIFALELRQHGSNFYFSVIDVPADGTWAADSARGSTVVQTGVWYHLALTSDGSSWKLYVNGVAETMTNQLGNGNTGRWFGNTTAASPDKTILAGCRFNGVDYPGINGLIDEMRIYDRVLTAGEIATLASGGGGTASEVQWLVADHLGTPRMIFDKTGSLAGMKRHDYLPFGEELLAGQGSRTTALGYTGDSVRQKFTLKERDIETGLDYFLARYCSSMQGRFTSPDILSGRPGSPQSWNRYAYSINNPLKYIDPDGLWWYTKNGGDGHPEWHDDDPGSGYTLYTQDVYYAGKEFGYVALDHYSKNYLTGFRSEEDATAFSNGMSSQTLLERDPGGEVSLLDGTLEVATYISAATGVVRVGAALTEVGLGAAARRGATMGTEEVVGLFGRVSVDALESAASSSGPTVQIVTKLTQFPQAGRALSVATGDAAEVLANASRSTGHLYRANVPQALLAQLERSGLAVRSTTQMIGSNATATEYRFFPQATRFITSFFKE